MKPKFALQVIAIISLVGMLFSGALTYREFFTDAAASCSALGASGTILGYPPCVYGLVMYTVVFATALLGLQRAESRPPAATPHGPTLAASR
jgi:uncharacterized membrane protein